MCRQFSICLPICILLLMAGCSSSPHLPGYLYAFQNNGFTVTDLNSGKVIDSVIGPKNMDFTFATKIDNNRILIGGWGETGQNTWIYNRSTGVLLPFKIPPYSQNLQEAKYWLEMPVYMAKYQQVIYYCGPSRLCAVSVDRSGEMEVIDSNASHNGGMEGIGHYPIVPISDDEIVYATNNGELKMYNLRIGKIEKLPIPNCIPQLWRSKTKQLLCMTLANKSRNPYYLIKLDGSNYTLAPYFKGGPAIYLPDHDVVLAGGLTLLDGDILRSYNLTTDKVHAFARGAFVHPGGTVWFPDVPKDIPGIKVTLAASAAHH